MIFINFISKKQMLLVGLFSIVLIISLFLATYVGGINVYITDLFFSDSSSIQKRVLIEIRIPRVLLAGFVGASLALAGASLQGLFRNPLADPGLIGVSAGAAFGAAFMIVVGSNYFSENLFGTLLLPFASILGAGIVTLLLFSFTKGFGYNGVTYMILVGIAINAFATVGIGILTFISTDSQLRGLTFWTMGSFGAANWNILLPAICMILVTIFWLVKSARKLDLLQLGEAEAFRLGVDVKYLKVKIIVASAIIVGVSVSLSGIIGFVGLVVPHLVRLIGGVKHQFVLVGSVFLGSSIMIISDLVSSSLYSNVASSLISLER